MKKDQRTAPSLPSIGTILMVAAVFAIPLMLWGDRLPWLAGFPVALIVWLTVRSEIKRIRQPTEVPLRVEFMLPTAAAVQWTEWRHIDEFDDQWIAIIQSKKGYGDMKPPTASCPPVPVRLRDEGLLAVA
jgi:hypothetical protein